VTGNPPPEVSLNGLAAGTELIAPTNLTLSAEASSGAGPIAKVEFFSGVKKIGEAVNSPYTLTWSNVPPGNWCLSAKATDAQGGMRSSIGVPIKVTGSAGNPFLATMGSYSGLFISSNPPAFATSGYFTLNTTSQGTFAGRLICGGKKYPLKGRFDSFGSAQVVVPRTGLTPLIVELNLDLSGITDQIHGSVSDGTWAVRLEGDRAVRSLTDALPRPGRYAWLLPGSQDATDWPGGFGFGLVNVSPAGRLNLTATLGDGTRATQTTSLSKAGRSPLYASLYGGQGAIYGWITFQTDPGRGLQGDLQWFKPSAITGPLYPAGFTAQASISGALYHAPNAGERLFDWTNGLVVLAGGNLGFALTNHVQLDANQRLVVANNDAQLKITIALATGSVRGSFIHPVTHQRVNLRGTVESSLGLIGGLFQGTDQTGSLLIVPSSSP